jgi:hypothetical protein
MSTATLARKLTRLEVACRERTQRDQTTLDRLRTDPTQIMCMAAMSPDPWQEGVLRTDASRMLLLASRQSGKSSVAAALSLHTALSRPRSPVLLLSPSLRQSSELFRKVLDLFNAAGRPVPVAAESALRLELANGSRVVALPGDEKNVRCFSGVAMLVIDEAARVADALYCAVRPMLAVSKGRLVALSTPFGKRGWFHDEWYGNGDWERVRITAAECPRISADFLAEEKRSMGERWYRQEFECSFEAAVGAVFNYEDIQAAFVDDLEPFFAKANQ